MVPQLVVLRAKAGSAGPPGALAAGLRRLQVDHRLQPPAHALARDAVTDTVLESGCRCVAPEGQAAGGRRQRPSQQRSCAQRLPSTAFTATNTLKSGTHHLMDTTNGCHDGRLRGLRRDVAAKRQFWALLAMRPV